MLSSFHLRNSTRCFSKQGLSQPRLLQPRSKQAFRQWDTEAPLRRKRPRLNKTTGRAHPKKPVHPPRQDTPADPTHEKLLAVLSNAARLPDAGEGGTTMACADSPSVGPGDTNMPRTAESTAGWPPRQATSSHLPARQYVTHGHIQYRVTEDGTHEHLPPPRAFAHPKKCPVQ